ncbi:DUF4153 domain-containing protein [Hoeflea prorocentri]|uniref:DUF4153 domain-containing protein n=1 Tax=Hoeflea prorocentri TaxID=1922333 RepID=A0A9X3ULE2_9HYPH|nr:DUF4153 domain-containing protein [Hoeflea prorocentri]MCY6381349.1 DUF4153 domain-containing protein [Hoeflea prorocentri]MDA5399149.1 DUF4153 domain-containing protein [Hoeflea prorocentri]
MVRSNRLGRLLPDLSQTLYRFPVPVAFSVSVFIIGTLQIAGVISPGSIYEPNDHSHRLFAEPLYGALASAFLASGAAHLYAESRHWNAVRGIAVAVATGLIATAPFWLAAALNMTVLFMFWMPGLVLCVMVAGYLSNNDDNAMWMFNARLAMAIVLAVIVALVFFLGLAAVVESVEYLFAVNFGSDSMSYLICAAVTLVGPLFGLSMVSSDLDESFDPQLESGLLISGSRLLLNYLLVPLVLVYVAILYLYAGRILLEWDLPRGQIGLMVLLFSIGGTAVWLIAKPWAESGSRLLGTFGRLWFFLLIVPLCLLAIGLYRRVSDYGLTPERYGLAIVGIWLLLTLLWRSVRPSAVRPRFIVGSLAILLVAASFGPWGAVSMTVQSQFSRLASLMEEAGHLENGKIDHEAQFDPAVSNEGYSIVTLLSRAGRLDLLASWFDGHPENPFEGDTRQARLNATLQVLNFVRSATGTAESGHPIPVYFSAQYPIELNSGADAILSGVHRFGDGWTGGLPAGRERPAIIVEGGKLIIAYDGDAWEIASAALLEKARASQDESLSKPLVFVLPGDRGTAQLALIEIDGRIDPDRTVINFGRANLVLPRGD